MNYLFSPSEPRGIIAAPPSKSHAHRLLLCAALADGESAIGNIGFSQDLQATLDCLRACGAGITAAPVIAHPSADRRGSPFSNNSIRIRGFDPFSANAATLNCRESASTLRFLLPLCLLSGEQMTFTGSPRLFARPLGVYETLCRENGFLYQPGEAALTVQGRLTPGRYVLPGGVSSQFASGMLFALPLLDGDSRLELTPPVVSRPYLDLTLAVLSDFGIFVRKIAENHYEIPGNQHFSATNLTVSGDWSNAAPFFALHALGYDVSVAGLDAAVPQADRVCVPLLEQLSRGFARIDLRDCPDLGPVLFCAAALLHGGCFTGTHRLRDKESDRVAAMESELKKCGVSLRVEADTVTVAPAEPQRPVQPLSSHNDHRIAMALSLILLRTGGTLRGADCVSKSDPQFFDKLNALGISLQESSSL